MLEAYIREPLQKFRISKTSHFLYLSIQKIKNKKIFKKVVTNCAFDATYIVKGSKQGCQNPCFPCTMIVKGYSQADEALKNT